ncbi:hypothetical protein Acr_27g0002630 [Actinidia rufa]|uniref:Uncharacterized protein n=1 Tax=Actinidia rufa TaxID=165716 RepID=A0A7J0H702_9ERIC|nr:hypothetical protein Acr_00g0000690 [Actinidia rufa]GFY99282.1 hypothetical protein Acr_13g0006830 [Actinidia rufa]GFZ18516.1 hypothetical protein Acr_27g0002550 [Actinidia rufa]GFZ18524.1 hypothetical protein Acr_27g0002630 [Actinidia rufa]
MTALVVKKRGIEEQSYMPPVIPYWPAALSSPQVGVRCSEEGDLVHASAASPWGRDRWRLPWPGRQMGIEMQMRGIRVLQMQMEERNWMREEE